MDLLSHTLRLWTNTSLIGRWWQTPLLNGFCPNVLNKERDNWGLARVFPWRLVFTSDGLGVVIRSIELYDKWNVSDFVYDSVTYDQVKTRSSESQAEELGKSQSVGTCIVNGLSFPFCFRLRQSGFHLIVSYEVISRIGRKWKLCDSSDSDSVSLATPLTISTPTSSLVKTSL